MTDNVVGWLTDFMLQQQLISESEREFFSYGCKQTIFLILFVIGALVIGHVMDMFWETLLFLITYSALRSYAGGWHFRTKNKCMIGSLLLIPVTLLFASVESNGFLLLLFVSFIIIYIMSPLDDPNKRLDSLERRVFRKRARIILCILSLVALGLFEVSPQIANIVVTSISLVAILQLISIPTMLGNN